MGSKPLETGCEQQMHVRPSSAQLLGARRSALRVDYCSIALWPYSSEGVESEPIVAGGHMLGYALPSHSVQLSPRNIAFASSLPFNIMSHHATATSFTRSDSIISVR